MELFAKTHQLYVHRQKRTLSLQWNIEEVLLSYMAALLHLAQGVSVRAQIEPKESLVEN